MAANNLLTPTTYANADTGTTGNFISLSDQHVILNVQPTPNPVRVLLPDGSTAVSTHTGVLNLPALPMAARSVDIFPQWVGSLLSIGRLCDKGLAALYTTSPRRRRRRSPQRPPMPSHLPVAY